MDFSSVEYLPVMKAAVAFVPDSAAVFRDDVDIVPVRLDKDVAYMPWGADNLLPYRVLELIESDETLSTCQVFNAEVCYAGGLSYESADKGGPAARRVHDFFCNNDIPSYFLGACEDFKHFGFAVSVIILNKARNEIVRLVRKEACYCRFAPADSNGSIPYVLYANWRKLPSSLDNVERIPLLNTLAPLADLQSRMADKNCRDTKFAVVSRIPTADSTYYPIPYYASLFKGKWYNIKQLIGTAKEAKLKNSAPIKYHIQISTKYWEDVFRQEGITDTQKQREKVVEVKQQILDFLTGVENSGKVWFSRFFVTPDGREMQDIRISKIDSAKEGGDYESDIQEAINMFCFTMRVHSNLVGSVPGKGQSNNSGSDKRELYTIAQALQRPYHDILFNVHRLIIAFNGWEGFRPVCPLLQLTTLDEHRDIKEVDTP